MLWDWPWQPCHQSVLACAQQAISLCSSSLSSWQRHTFSENASKWALWDMQILNSVVYYSSAFWNCWSWRWTGLMTLQCICSQCSYSLSALVDTEQDMTCTASFSSCSLCHRSSLCCWLCISLFPGCPSITLFAASPLCQLIILLDNLRRAITEPGQQLPFLITLFSARAASVLIRPGEHAFLPCVCLGLICWFLPERVSYGMRKKITWKNGFLSAHILQQLTLLPALCAFFVDHVVFFCVACFLLQSIGCTHLLTSSFSNAQFCLSMMYHSSIRFSTAVACR